MDILLWIALLFSVFILLLFFPTRRNRKGNDFTKLQRFHEADAVLSRRKLEPGTPSYDDYYEGHPRYKEADDKARSNPGLLSPKSKYYDPVTFSAAEVNFRLTESLYSFEKVPVSSHRYNVDKKHLTNYIMQWMMQAGAHSAGVTALKDYHLYSHKGRGTRNGEKIIRDLPTAIAITVEMDHGEMSYAPAGPTVKESSWQYLRSGMLATKLALFIRKLGYHAKAHIDGNYEVICPLVAEDAGLGVIGRMGLLMTPNIGPRVRIAVVTTDIPLEYNDAGNYGYIIDFCRTCKKCAEACPANAIPKGPKTNSGGVQRWKIDSEKCYHFWTLAGTDCGRCVIVCPFSHPDTGFHQFVRWGIKNNLLFRRIAVKLDNIFYGRKPSPRPLPEWFRKIN